jgi:hypothetical protein
MIGQRIEGEIVRVLVPEYEYVDPKTGEILRLQHSWAYQPDGSSKATGHTRVGSLEMA